MKCPNCGQPVSPDDAFCGECGTKLTPQTSATSSTSEQSQHHHSTEQHTQTPQQTATSEDNSTSTNASHHQSTNQQYTQSNDHTFNQQPNGQQYGQQQAPYGQQSQQYNQYQQQPNGQQQQPSQLVNQVKDVAQESKGFFSGAFISPDHLINNRKVFSYKLLASLIVIGFIVMAIALAIFSRTILSGLLSGFISGTLIMRILLIAFAFIAVNIGATYVISKLMVRGRLTFQQVLSDYVLINSITIAIFIIGVFAFIIGTYTFASAIMLITILLFIISGMYLVAKYSGRDQVKFSSFYAIVIYLIIIFVFVRVLGESLVTTMIHSISDSAKDVFPGSGSSSWDSNSESLEDLSDMLNNLGEDSGL
ncbi:zinc-ribbon domain-containing protein [Staphylococcus simiae]|uniref:zinc ribbon domain-containing protein n=1 Tax=Staphylococcus simiae TaxID=308354 RepID=UPI001A96F52F|nr:zinc ribbon domain-containing protein [Staphylococcus simiae]MBO1198433.1 zinc-ribbon domain-containing protein [Staphylococcus simiae]MBO1200627.1 zinc-ribbon domain-containing protein [Staphylococcus simiae]MBO1202898.1 zinc-ribbon domain-containing protein [Staphylococcus simiae]MBO1210424.1 zinc-ribbon domain-containing protein [Staphylococcus simiae]MBO1228964.1 zinc-ribbon domain-containing protein [Staphylococcus simiae]